MSDKKNLDGTLPKTRIEKEKEEEIRKLADQDGRSVGGYIRKVMSDHLKEKEKNQ